MKRHSLHTVLICAGLVLAAPLVSAGQTAGRPIAVVDGQPIYEQDLMSVAGERLFELRNQEYKLKSEALDTVIRKKLLEAEAKKKGLTTEELLKQEVESKIPEPSDEEAKGYFLAAQNHATLSFETLKPQVKQFIRNAEIEEARKKYEESLRAKANLSILLQPPSVEVAYDPARVKGDPEAPITIIEFSDFQCPFCKKAQPALNEVLAKYNGRVKLAYMDFPLREIHADALGAAEAARCAGDQGKFWEFHDLLFADQSKLKDDDLANDARKLGLDAKSFQACLASGKHKPKVEEDRQQGAKVGVAGTPAFFINGVFLNGAQPQSEFEKVIDSQLALASNSSAAR